MIPEYFSLARLGTLAAIVHSYADHSVEFVRPIFERSHTHFQDTLDGATHLGLIEIAHGQLAAKQSLTVAFGHFTNPVEYNTRVAMCVLRALFRAEGRIAAQMSALATRFDFADSRFVWYPRTAEIPQFIGLRNVLLELGVLTFVADQECYVLATAFAESFMRISTRRKLSPEQLQRLALAQQGIGTAAELAVLNFERAALANAGDLAARVLHVAAADVSAGYDILSFERSELPNGQAIERYIEVKAVSPVDWRFHWSRSEMECAKRLGASYYLYLVPVGQHGVPNVKEMQSIKNAYNELLSAPNPWSRACDSYEFWTAES